MLIKKNKIIILFLFLLLFCFILISNSKTASAINFTPQVTIPGSDFQAGASTEIENSTATIGKYIKSFYNYLIAIVGLVAAIVLMLAGVIWLTAAGNTSKISQAKGLMMGSFTGIVLVLTSYIILKTINPGLVEFRDTVIEAQTAINVGCCVVDLPTKKVSENIGANSCYLEIKDEIEANKQKTKIIETDIEKLKKILKDNYSNSLEKYLIKKGVFYPGLIANYANGRCEKKIYCIYCDIYQGQGAGPGGSGTIKNMITTGSQCQELKGLSIPEDKSTSPISQNDWKKILGQDSACDTQINNGYIQKSPQEIITKIESINKNLCSGKEDGEHAEGWSNLWCYNERVFENFGKVNEPCGDDGGICVDTNGDSCKDAGYDGRENRGGRSCSGSKCCYKD